MSTTVIRSVKLPSPRQTELEVLEKDGGANNRAGFLARAVALHLAGKREEALKQLQRAVASNESSPEIYRAMGHIQFEQGNFSDAAKSYKSLTQQKPQYAVGWFNLAVCHERMGAWEDACEAFHK